MSDLEGKGKDKVLDDSEDILLDYKSSDCMEVEDTDYTGYTGCKEVEGMDCMVEDYTDCKEAENRGNMKSYYNRWILSIQELQSNPSSRSNPCVQWDL